MSITLYCTVRCQGEQKPHYYITIPQEHIKNGLLAKGVTYEVVIHPLPEKPAGKKPEGEE